jgi:hypothetical protein
MKVLISKRYTLPTMVLEALIDYFCKTGMEGRGKSEEEIEEMEEGLPTQMPVMWHQTILALV